LLASLSIAMFAMLIVPEAVADCSANTLLIALT